MTETRILKSDVPATVVPSGEAITITAGSEVTITHRLGGNFTVTWEYGMARIAGAHAEALGEEKAQKKEEESDGGVPTEKKLWEALKTVYDPEIPVNIVDLGLVYSLEMEPMTPTEGSPEKKSETPAAEMTFKVWMKMTLTAPGCGMGPAIAADAKERMLQVKGIADAQVDIVWEPAWNQEMISEAGKMELGLI